MSPARRLSRCAMTRRTELIPFYRRFAAQASLIGMAARDMTELRSRRINIENV
jgi:hypothetical protein